MIRAQADQIDVVFLGQTLGSYNGINGTFFDTPSPADRSRVYGVAVGSEGVIGAGVPWVAPRATILYDGERIRFDFVADIRPRAAGLKWAISGGNLLPVDLAREKFQADVARRTAHTALMTKGAEVYLVVKDNSVLADFTRYAKDHGMDHAIFLDGGGSTQLNWYGKGIKSTRRISTAVIVKE